MVVASASWFRAVAIPQTEGHRVATVTWEHRPALDVILSNQGYDHSRVSLDLALAASVAQTTTSLCHPER